MRNEKYNKQYNLHLSLRKLKKNNTNYYELIIKFIDLIHKKHYLKKYRLSGKYLLIIHIIPILIFYGLQIFK